MKLRAFTAILATSFFALVLTPLTASAVGEIACDPAIEVCATPEPTPSVTPVPTPSPSVSPTPTPTPVPSSATTGASGCGDFWANPLQNGLDCSKPNGAPTDIFTNGALFKRIANALVFLVGAVSVIMIIFGGLKYVVSMGNAKAVTSARDTILYALVGVAVAAMSFAIINFVINALGQAK